MPVEGASGRGLRRADVHGLLASNALPERRGVVDAGMRFQSCHGNNEETLHVGALDRGDALLDFHGEDEQRVEIVGGVRHVVLFPLDQPRVLIQVHNKDQDSSL